MIKVIFLIGKPACGKDTQADLLAEKFNLKKITTSKELEYFLSHYKKKYFKIGNIKINLKKQLINKNKGKLVSYRLISFLVNKLIKENIKNGNSIIFAGSPRSRYEAKNAIKLLKKLNVDYYFIYLKIRDKTAIKRMLIRSKIEKRADDNLKTIRLRLKLFKNEIMPMINYLKSKKNLNIVNGEGSIKQVNKRLINIIKK
ncbi:MAG: adenylate kinase [Candidatus Parcubacteria bacterium]|nr:MAG: adenylate kinase [Candidatus Parcubacteria bacterium]